MVNVVWGEVSPATVWGGGTIHTPPLPLLPLLSHLGWTDNFLFSRKTDEKRVCLLQQRQHSYLFVTNEKNIFADEKSLKGQGGIFSGLVVLIVFF